MSYTVSLYRNTSDPNHMNKSISHIADVECDIKAPVDVENPELNITATDTVDDVNYIYIGEFHRYYFAKAIAKRGYLITFECISDPLMSFKSAILNCNAVVARNAWHYDKYIHDGKLPIEARTIRGTFKFPNTTLFNGSNNCYILTTIGPGGGS